MTDEGKERVWNKRKRTERTEGCESGKFLNCFHIPIFLIPFVPYSLSLHVQVTEY
jgi:hypothetical protein